MGDGMGAASLLSQPTKQGRGEEASCPPLNPRNPPFPSGQLARELPGPGCTPSSEARGDDGITTLPQAPLISFALSIPFSPSPPPNLFPFLLSHTSPLSFTNGKEKLLNIAPLGTSKSFKNRNLNKNE